MGGATYLDQQPSSDADYSNRADNMFCPFSSGDDEQLCYSPSSFENRKYGAYDITRSDEYPSASTALPFQGSLVNPISSSSDCICPLYNPPLLETIREVPPSSDKLASRTSNYVETEKERGREEENSPAVDTINTLKSSSVTIHLSDSDVNAFENSEKITAPGFSEQRCNLPSSSSPPPVTATATATPSSRPPYPMESRMLISSIPCFHDSDGLLPGGSSSLSLSDPSIYQYQVHSVNRMLS